MALIDRFKGYYKATFVLTGNNQSIRTAAGAMTGNVYSTPTGGTTTNYLLAGSTAYFNMIPNSNVLYADLIWTGMSLGTSVEFKTPTETVTVTSQAQQSGGWTSCMADVTTLVKNGGSGKYECNKINGGIGYSGWFLTIAYENQSFPLRYLSYVGGAVNDGSATITLTDIYTPKSGPIKANIFAGAYGSDLPDRAAIRIGPTASNLTQVGNPTPLGTPWNGQKPYNPKFAFLSNIICNCDPYDPNYSLLDTRGTFGTPNSDPYLSINPANSRAWMDIGSMDVSDIMQNGQTQLVARSLITGGGWFTQNLFALQVDINSAVLEIVKAASKSYANSGDEILYTLAVKNTGSEDALNVVFYDTLPSNATFVPSSLTIDSTPSSSDPSSGVNLGNVLYQQVKTLTFKATISNTVLTGDTIVNKALVTYSYTPSNTIPTQFTSSTSNFTVTTIINDSTSVTKSISVSSASINSTITYTSVIKNFNLTTITNIVFFDSIPETTTFIPNSVFINGISKPGENPQNSISTNIDLAPNELLTVSFDVFTAGPSGTIPNTSKFDYSLKVNSDTIPLNKISNTVYFEYKFPEFSITKFVDKNFSTNGDTLAYTIVLLNYGNHPSISNILKDTIPTGTSFINNSVTINGTPSSSHPQTGIPISSIAPNETVTVSFKVKVD